MKQSAPEPSCSIERPLDKRKLRRMGVVAIGRVMQVDAYLARLSMYR